MKKVEKILVVVFILGQIMRLFYLPGGEILSLLSATILALMYLMFGFALLNGARSGYFFRKSEYAGLSRTQFWSAVFGGFALFVAIMGILFKLQFYGGANLLVDAGFVLLVIALVINLSFYFNNKRGHFKSSLERLVPCSIIALALVATPISSLIDIYYRDSPDYAKELKQAFEKQNGSDNEVLHN